ncbi:MAG: glycosyltransferase [Deltaproteobacteria bacterium]|nr:glycosyltransferase [Deltaproteobacteria bacterium]
MKKKIPNILIVIPARGGSKGIPHKNVRLLGNYPLIWYSIHNAKESNYDPVVVVSTDNKEISGLSEKYGVQVIARPKSLAEDNVTLDPVVHHAVRKVENQSGKLFDLVITMQPTSPLLTTFTLDKAIENFIENDFDTVISGVNRPHLSWTRRDGDYYPLYKKRLNRQYLPAHIQETGAFVISKREHVTPASRIGPRVSLFEIPEEQAIDIDTSQDWWVAEKELNKKIIMFRVEGYSKIGLGHIYRCLSLFFKLIDHDVFFVLSSKSDLGIAKIKQNHIPYEVITDNSQVTELIRQRNVDIVVNDILDTDADYIKQILSTGVRVVNFEDLGSGANLAHAVINDLYEKQKDGDHYYWGSKYYCIRDEFLLANHYKFKKKPKEILVLFGGTDPADLTMKLLNVVNEMKLKDLHFTFIVGMGYGNVSKLKNIVKKNKLNVEIIQSVKFMTRYMEKADLAISSQGRTMLELASMAVPTILLAQNKRELHHEFGYLKNGFLNLGIGKDVNIATITETVKWLVNTPQIRKQMHNQMLSFDLKKGIKRVLKVIFEEDY